MAGSYRHIDAGDRQLLVSEDFAEMIEHLSDAYETVEHMYGMIWWLAERLAASQKTDSASFVDAASKNYKEGLEASPGTAGTLPVEEERQPLDRHTR